MKIEQIEGNTQKLDGGAMFGNCPKTLWKTWATPDSDNRISLNCRAMLVREDSGRNVLLETGIGMFFDPKMRQRYGVEGDRHLLVDELHAKGLRPSDIDVIILSHLHFDHAGGLLTSWEKDKALELAFPKASFVVGKAAWARAKRPHPRDKASFIPELLPLLENSGRLVLTAGPRLSLLGDAYTFLFSDGHTPGLMLTRVEAPFGPITFMGDLIPGAFWVHLPITMGYDRNPELLVDEKKQILDDIIHEKGWLYYTHDPSCVCSQVERDEKGKYQAIFKQSSMNMV